MIIRQATKEEFKIAIKWAADEGWNPGIEDLDVFHATDPDGFLMGFEDGEPICAISVVKYQGSFGFLGFYITRRDKRGLGYGIQIWEAGLEYLEGFTIGLDGVVEQQSNYQTSGFEFSHRNIRYRGKVEAISHQDGNVRNVDEILLDSIIEYDTRHFPANRNQFSYGWYSIQSAARHSKVYIQNQQIVGLGSIRRCQEGYKIGPLFSDNSEIALSLFKALCAELRNETVFVDIPEPNTHAIRLFEDLGFQPVFETARMYLGKIPEKDLSKIFGITTFELG